MRRSTAMLATRMAAYVLLLIGMFAVAPSSAAAAGPKPTIVLVHGAFAESASWDPVIGKLTSDGYPVLAVANPLRGVKSDADYVAATLRGIKGPIVLVGHSYGGSVISNAATGNAQVTALVFVAGFAPEAGESAAALSAKFPGSTLGPTLAPPIALAGGKDLYITPEKFPAQFAADLPLAQAKTMAVTQRPILAAALDEPAGAPAWKTIPSYFVYGQLDKNIPAAAHAFMAQRAGAKKTLQVAGASHVVMISHPDSVARMIADAATAK